MRACLSKLCCLLAGAMLLASSAVSVAQKEQPPANCSQTPAEPTPQSPAETSPSLAAAARGSKAQKTARAKKVFTDEDMEVNAGPLPRMTMDGAENSDEVVAAIVKYKANHTPEQTEEALRMWYDRYDEILVATIQENRDMATLSSTNMSNGRELCQQSQDYEKCQSRQMAEQRGSRADSNRMTKNFALMNRIQRVFMKVRTGMQANNLRYSWFRIQNNTFNGDDL